MCPSAYKEGIWQGKDVASLLLLGTRWCVCGQLHVPATRLVVFNVFRRLGPQKLVWMFGKTNTSLAVAGNQPISWSPACGLVSILTMLSWLQGKLHEFLNFTAALYWRTKFISGNRNPDQQNLYISCSARNALGWHL